MSRDDTVDARLDEHDELLGVVVENLETVSERLLTLEQQVPVTGPGTGDEEPTPLDVDWTRLDAVAAGRLWDALIDWVDWLADAFPIRDALPGCWPRHPALLWDLTALYRAHQDAYRPDAPGAGPLGWIEQLHRAQARWRDWDVAQCVSRLHTGEFAALTWSENWRHEAQEFAAADLVGRPAPETAP